MAVAGLSQSRMVQATIKRVGVQDVELFYDVGLGIWGVYQVRKINTGIITLDNLEGAKVEQLLMWYCTNKKGEYRPPDEQDIHNVIATVHRAEHWFKQGGDALADELEAQEDAKKAVKDKKISDKIQSIAKPLKKAIKKELG
jgi:hypothetical protein